MQGKNSLYATHMLVDICFLCAFVATVGLLAPEIPITGHAENDIPSRRTCIDTYCSRVCLSFIWRLRCVFSWPHTGQVTLCQINGSGLAGEMVLRRRFTYRTRRHYIESRRGGLMPPYCCEFIRIFCRLKEVSLQVLHSRVSSKKRRAMGNNHLTTPISGR